MKASQFEYSAPTTVGEAVGLIAEKGPDGKILAGGQSLVPLLNFRLARPLSLIDINGVDELNYVNVNGGMVIGGLTRLTTLEELSSTNGLMAKALPHVGHRAIRNRGTIGGSLAHNDPAAELPAVLMVLNAEVTATSSAGERSMTVSDLVGERFFETTLDDSEMITEVRIPATGAGERYGFAEFSRRHGDFAIAGVAIAMTINESIVESVAIGAFGGAHAVRLAGTESALVGCEFDDAAVAAAGEAAAAEFPSTSDIHGDADYRRHLVGVLTRRALRESADQEVGK